MKKNIFLFFCIALSAVSCDPAGNTWQWSVKNNTDQTLKLSHLSFVPYVPTYSTISISPGETVYLYRVTLECKYGSNFGDYFRKSAETYEDDVYWEILSEDDVKLASWNYSDRSLPDQRFFEESSWAFDSKPGQSARIVLQYTWTFEISPQDIEP
jgi:hypothetical protein